MMAQFTRLSEAPDAVAKLRDLVWGLAVTGRLAATHRGGSSGWKRVTLGSTGQWGSGGTPLKGNPDYYDGDIPWLVIGDLNDGLVTNARTSITNLGLTQSSAKMVEPGCVLVAMYGSIGKLGLAGIRCATNQAIAHCIPSDDVAAAFLMVALRSMRKALLARGQGGAQPNISQTILKAWPILLPPLAEQHRIVAKVDELMAVCDELDTAQTDREARRDRLRATSLQNLVAPDESTEHAEFFLRNSSRMITKPEHVADVRQEIQDLAVQGRLVDQDPKDEPAGELLTQVTALADVPPSRAVHSDETVETFLELPVGWVSARVSQLFRVTGGIQKQPKRAPQENAWPYVGVRNVQRGRLDLRTVARFELFPGELERLRLEPGDLLVVEGNGSPTEIGRCARWSGEIADCVHQNHIIRVRPLLTDVDRFALLYLNSPLGMATMRDLAITTAGLYSLSVGKIQRITMPLPPLAEQRRIVAKVDELMSVCDELELSLANEQSQRAGLLEALLHDALEDAVPERELEVLAAR